MKSFPHALYFSEDLLLNYFPIDFKEISSTILAKSVGAIAPVTLSWPRHRLWYINVLYAINTLDYIDALSIDFTFCDIIWWIYLSDSVTYISIF